MIYNILNVWWSEYSVSTVPENGIEIDYIKAVHKVNYVYRVGVFSKLDGDTTVYPKSSDIHPSFLKIQNALVAMINAIESKA